MRNKIKQYLESPKVQNVLLVIIVVNSIILGIMTSDTIVDVYGDILRILDYLCLAIFIIELLISLYAYGREFFVSGWNIFDLIIVVVSIVPSAGVFRSLRLLRALRVLKSLRTVRVISRLRSLRIIVQAIFDSLPGIGWTSLLMLMIYYIFAIIGTTLFGEVFPQWFGNLGDTFYTLFQVMTLESWSMGIARPVMEIYPWAYAYFVPFVLITTFLMLNVVIGLVVNTIGEISQVEKDDDMNQECIYGNIQLMTELSHIQKQLEVFSKKVQAYEEGIKKTEAIRNENIKIS